MLEPVTTNDVTPVQFKFTVPPEYPVSTTVELLPPVGVKVNVIGGPVTAIIDVTSTASLKLKIKSVLGVEGSELSTELDTTFPDEPSSAAPSAIPTELKPAIVNVVVIPLIVCVTLSPLSIGVAVDASQSNVVCAFYVAIIKKAIINIIFFNHIFNVV